MDRMYVLVNEDLKMSRGKTAAQVAHAVARIKAKRAPDIMIILKGTGDQLHNLHHYLESLNIQSSLYIDEGVNEIPPFSITALAVEPFDDNREDLKELFSGFELLKDRKWFR